MNKRYQDYLSSGQWRRKRDAVMSRSQGVCEICEERRATQVHHVRYPKQLGDEPLTDLLAVCRQCHEKSHGMIERNRNELILTFEGADIRSVVLDDDSPLFPWGDIEAAVFRKDNEMRAASRPESRASLKAQMREVRHWESRGGVDYLTEHGVYRWAQIFPRPAVWADDAILWRFSDWVEDQCKHIREGKIAIVQMSDQPATLHPQVFQAVELLLQQAREESRRNDTQDQEIQSISRRVGVLEKLPTPAKDPDEFQSVRDGCLELAIDPNTVPGPGRSTIDQVAGRILSKAAKDGAIPAGPKKQWRLPDSGVLTSVNTYKRKHVHRALEKALAGRG